MSISDIYLIVPNPALAGLIWFFILSALLYLARLPAKKTILAFSEVLHNALRLAANSVNSADLRLQARNREVLLEAGREASERMIEREFTRVEDSVTMIWRNILPCIASSVSASPASMKITNKAQKCHPIHRSGARWWSRWQKSIAMAMPWCRRF